MDFELVKYLACLAGRNPQRWCPEPPMGKLRRVAGYASAEIVLARIRELERVGRIKPRTMGHEPGWVVPKSREWARLRKRRADRVVAAASYCTGRDAEFLRACGIAWE